MKDSGIQETNELLFNADFNKDIPSQFSGSGKIESVRGYEGVGNFSGNFLINKNLLNPTSKAILTLTDIPEHSSINLDFLLATIETWDGSGGEHGSDFFNVVVDGETIFSETFLAPVGSGSEQSYDPPEGVFLERKDFGFEGGGVSAGYNMGLDPTFANIPHTSSTLTIEWFADGAGWQGYDDEFWAIDNVKVSVNEGSEVLPTVSIAPDKQPFEIDPQDNPINIDPSGNFNLTLSQPAPAEGITVNYAVAGTATSDEDYESLSGSVEIAEGETSATIDVTPINDDLNDPAETVRVTLDSGDGYTVGDSGTATLAIEDEDSVTGAIEQIAPPSSVELNVKESDNSIFAFPEQQEINLSNALSVDITESGTYSEGENLTPGQISAGTKINSYFLHFDQIGTSGTQVQQGSIAFSEEILGIIISRPGLNASDNALGAMGTTYPTGTDLARGAEEAGDFVALDGQTITVDLTTISGPDQLRVITAAEDTESLPTVSIAPDKQPQEIDSPQNNPINIDPSGNFNLTLSQPAPVGGITINYTVAGTATSGEDYESLSGSVEIAEGETSATIDVTPIDDEIADPDETVKVTLNQGQSYNLGDSKAATLTIVDNDQAGVSISETDGSTEITEDGATDTYKVVLDSKPTADVNITFNTDSEIQPISSLTFTPDNWDTPQTITVAAVDDDVDEGKHTGTITPSVNSEDDIYDGLTVEDVTATIVPTAPINLAPLRITADSFSSTDDGFFEAFGNIKLGLEESAPSFPLLTLEGGTVKFNQDKFIADNVIVSSAIGDVNNSLLFEGDFEIDVGTAKFSSLNDATGNNTQDFQLAGLDVQLSTLGLTQEGIELGGSILLLPELNSRPIGLGSSRIVIDSNGNVTVEGAELQFPNVNFTVANTVDFTSTDLSASYISDPDPALKLQGQAELSLDINSDPTNPVKVGANFAGNNFIKINGNQDPAIDLNGSVFASNIELVPGVWELQKAELSVDTTTDPNQLSGTAKILTPTGLALNAKELEFRGSKLNSVILELANLNRPIGQTGVFLQSILGGVEEIATNKPITFGGGIGLTAGPEVSVSLPSWAGGNFSDSALGLDLVGSISENRLTTEFSNDPSSFELVGGLAGGEVVVTLDWDSKFLEGNLTLDALAGVISAESSFTAQGQRRANLPGNRNVALDLAINSLATVTLPTEILGSQVLQQFLGDISLSGNYSLQFIDDTIDSNDFIAGWASTTIDTFFSSITFLKGLKVGFDGSTEVIGSPEIADTSSFEVGAGREWILLSAAWDNSSDNAQVQVIDPDGNVINESDFADNNIAIAEELTSSTARTVLIDQPQEGIWDIQVVDDAGLGEVETSAFRDSAIPTIEITSISESGEDIIINYEAFDADSDAEVNLYYDSDNSGTDGVIITTGLDEVDGQNNFTWSPEGVPTGEYFIYAGIFDENNPPVFDYSAETIEITEEADVAVTKTADTTVIEADEDLTYTITVNNNGSAEATAVTLTETLPTEFDFVSATVTPTNQSDGTLTFDLGDIANGGSTSFDITVSPNTTGTVTTNASLVANTFDPNASNDTAFLSTQIIEPIPDPVDVSVARTDSADLAPIGENFTYTLTIANNGDGDATGVTLTEDLPAGVNFVDITSSDPEFQANIENSVITGNLGNLASGAEETVTVTVTPTVAEPLVAYTSVTSDQDDTNPGNNSIIQRTGTNVVEFNEVSGTARRDQLTGTSENDSLTGGFGADILTGEGGSDQFIYESIRDAGDTITDFEVGNDQIVLTGVLDSFGYDGSDALADGYVQVVEMGSNSAVQIDSDGPDGRGIFRPFILVENVAAADLSAASNFAF